MKIAILKNIVSELSQKIECARKKLKKEDKQLFQRLPVAIRRYLQGIENVQKCLNFRFISRKSISGIDFDAHSTLFEKIEKLLANPKPLKARATCLAQNVDDAFDSISQAVFDGNSWIKSIPHEHRITENEGILWWLGSFGQESEVEWSDFWLLLTRYMGVVYGFSIQKPRNTVSSLYYSMERGLMTCFGLDADSDAFEEEEVTMKIFQDFYARFGPWSKLYHKSLTLCNLFGEPVKWFLPTTNSEDVHTYFNRGKRPNGLVNGRPTFIIRYSSEPGCLCWQDYKRKIKIRNTNEGYTMKAESRRHENIPDIPSALHAVWNIPLDRHAKSWIKSLNSIGREVDGSGYEVIDESDEQKTASVEINQKLDKLSQMVTDVHDDFLQIGLRLMTHLDSTMPRLFFMLPEKTPDGLTLWDVAKSKVKQQFQTHWRVFILCEGNEFMDGVHHHGHHFTKHPGFSVALPKETFVKSIPYIRIGLKVACASLKLVSVGLVDVGPITDYLQMQMDGIDLIGVLNEFESKLGDIQEFFHETSDISSQSTDIMDDYKLLRSLLFDEWLSQERLHDGKCAALELMFHKGSGKQVWVCKEHRSGLVGLDYKYEYKDDPPPSLKHEFEEDACECKSPPSEPKTSPRVPPGADMSLLDFLHHAEGAAEHMLLDPENIHMLEHRDCAKRRSKGQSCAIS